MNNIDIFWKAYPRKIAKGQLRKTWVKLEKKKILPGINDLLEVLEVHKAEWIREKTEKKYIPYPSTWLNYEPWDDEIEVPKKKESNYKKLYPDAKDVKSNITQEEWQEKYGDPKQNRDKIAAIVPNLTKKMGG